MLPKPTASTNPNEGQSKQWGHVGIPPEPPDKQQQPQNKTTPRASSKAKTKTKNKKARTARKTHKHQIKKAPGSSNGPTPLDHSSQPTKTKHSKAPSTKQHQPQRPPPEPPPERPPAEPPPAQDTHTPADSQQAHWRFKRKLATKVRQAAIDHVQSLQSGDQEPLQGTNEHPPPVKEPSPAPTATPTTAQTTPGNSNTTDQHHQWVEQYLKEIQSACSELETFFGTTDLPDEKPKGHLRLMFNNIGGLSLYRQAHSSRYFIDQLAKYKVDVGLIGELGWNIKKIQPFDSWFERSKDVLLTQSYQLSCNSHDVNNHSGQQYGGTGVVALQEAQPRVVEKGTDATGLGRWTWMRLQGRHNQFVRVISAYRPCKNEGSQGTVYSQQLSYWENKKNPECPLKLFDQQLEALIQSWLDLGDHVVLGIDANEDIRTGKVHEWTRNLGLRDAIRDLHREATPPETCNKNTNKVPIDGLFVSPALQPSAGRYSSYGKIAATDHRALWVDIPFTSILGFTPPNKPKPPRRRLKGKDPRSRNKYN